LTTSEYSLLYVFAFLLSLLVPLPLDLVNFLR
jgi:hypothetical protein